MSLIKNQGNSVNQGLTKLISALSSDKENDTFFYQSVSYRIFAAIKNSLSLMPNGLRIFPRKAFWIAVRNNFGEGYVLPRLPAYAINSSLVIDKEGDTIPKLVTSMVGRFFYKLDRCHGH